MPQKRDLETKILKIKGDWQEVVDDCRSTVGKPPLGKEPSTNFKRRILIAEHSPIRDIHIKWIWRAIESFAATHWSRHKFECYIKSQRTDRTGVPRNKLPQDEPVSFTGDANCQNAIDAWRKRLCYMADPKTRWYAEDFKEKLRGVEPEISDVLVPNCVYRGGCPEMEPCDFYKRFLDWCVSERAMVLGEHTSIATRYEMYNQFFYERKGRENGGSETL